MAWQIGSMSAAFTDLPALDPERGTFRVAITRATADFQDSRQDGAIR